MLDFEDEKIAKISHHIESISQEMHIVKKAILNEQKNKETLAKKEKKRRDSLKKAQKKFKNISTNFRLDDYKCIEEKLKKLDINASAYIKQLVTLDLEKGLL